MINYEYAKTPIIWRVHGTDYNINHIISVKLRYNPVTRLNGLEIRIANGDTDTICFLNDYNCPTEDLHWEDHRNAINNDARECWKEWCSITNMNKGDV